MESKPGYYSKDDVEFYVWNIDKEEIFSVLKTESVTLPNECYIVDVGVLPPIRFGHWFQGRWHNVDQSEFPNEFLTWLLLEGVT